MKQRDGSDPGGRQDRLLHEHIHDPYRARARMPEPARCPQCGAVYEAGRWHWTDAPPEAAEEQLCQACQRINDGYPAGVVVLRGAFLDRHRSEISGLVRNVAAEESREHALHRIMAIEEEDGGLTITTTDIHLPHRIGHALRDAWEGELKTHYNEEGYFARVEWQRDE